MKTLKRVADEVVAVKKAAELMDIEHDGRAPYHTIIEIDKRWEEFLEKAKGSDMTIDDMTIIEYLRECYNDLGDDSPQDISYE